MKSQKTTHFGSAQCPQPDSVIELVEMPKCRNVSAALILYSMLLTPLLFLGEGLGVRCSAQVANGTGAGNCLSYDGVNDYVSVPHSASLNITNAITIEAWIKPTEDRTQIFVVKTAGGLATDLAYVLRWVAANGIKTEVGDGSTFYASPYFFPSLNEWHHIVGYYDGTSVGLYVDGVFKGSNTGPVTMRTTSTAVAVGYYPSFGQYFKGMMDEVSIWNRALTETEIRDNMCKKLTGSESGLVGYWRFDEGSGGTAYDASPNGNDGTLY